MPSAVSDSEGKFDASSVGFFADDCTIEVRARGFHTERLPVGPLCTKRSLGSCLHVEIDVVLRPSGP